jgi:transposase-like protein
MATFKAQVVLEILSGGKIVAEVSREHRVKPDIVAR